MQIKLTILDSKLFAKPVADSDPYLLVLVTNLPSLHFLSQMSIPLRLAQKKIFAYFIHTLHKF